MQLPIRKIALQRGDRARLETLVWLWTTAPRLVERAHIVLVSAAGDAGSTIWAQVGVSRPTVSRWLDRYDTAGLAGLLADLPLVGASRSRGFTKPRSLSARGMLPRHMGRIGARG